MTTTMKVMSCVTVVALALAGVTGCATYGEAAGLGGALDAGAGAIIGHQSGNAVAGALIGAAAGALTG
ncbi:MAG TPA: hypothetical protein PKV69_07555, partial [Candidatus Hydrogenedentes bacterium]|nr:hypothetical protein [Candidatus Hydrogenedentota bacterium]